MRLIQVLILATIFLSGCQSSDNTLEIDNNRVIYGLSQSLSGLDPHQHDSIEMGIIARQIYDTLLYRHPETGEFVPGLAESWSVSDDGLTYNFQLRQTVVFHDGTPFTSAAVVTSLNRMLNPEISSAKVRRLLRPLSAYQVIDEYNLNLILSEPYPALLDALSQIYTAIMNPTVLANYSIMRYQFHQSGTGPFILQEYLPEQRVALTRNPAYQWQPNFYDTPDTRIQDIEFRFIRDEAASRQAIEQGDVHIMQNPAPVDARALSTFPDIQIISVPVAGQSLQIYINLAQSPMENLAFRQALLYGSNRVALADTVYRGFSTVAWGPITDRTRFYNGGVEAVYAYDLTEAEALLDVMLYSDTDNDGLRDIIDPETGDSVPLRLRLIYPVDSVLPEVVASLQEQWRILGIMLDAIPVPGMSNLQQTLEAGNYHMALLSDSGVDPVFLNQYFLIDSPDNHTHHENARLNALLVEGSRERNTDARYLLYAEAQAIILQEALVIPLVEPVNLTAYRTDIQNLQFDAYGWYPILYNLQRAN